MRTVCGLDVYKDTIYLCILCETGEIFEHVYGVLTCELKTIIECAWGASRTKDCFFSRFSYHQTVVRKKNKMKVLVAVARKLLIAVWHVLHDGTDYVDFNPDCKAPATNG